MLISPGRYGWGSISEGSGSCYDGLTSIPKASGRFSLRQGAGKSCGCPCGALPQPLPGAGHLLGWQSPVLLLLLQFLYLLGVGTVPGGAQGAAGSWGDAQSPAGWRHQCWGGSEALGAALVPAMGDGVSSRLSVLCASLVRREETRADSILEEKRGFWHRTECWVGLSNQTHFPCMGVQMGSGTGARAAPVCS